MYITQDINAVEILGMFYEKKKFQKKNQTEFRIEKLIKKNGDKSYVK